MTGYIILIIIAVGGIILLQHFNNKREKRLIDRLEGMVDSARDGEFKVSQIDETMLSSVENSMSRFLDDCSVSERNLKEQNEKIQTLISDISHQTLTPISNILLYSQLLEERLAATEDGTKIAAIRQEAEKLSFLIESLVKTSRLETGIIKTVTAKTDVTELIDEIIEEGKLKAKDKSISLSFTRPSGEIFAGCDGKWTREALYNILDNAIKYTPQGGSIKLSVEEYSMFCRIDISDTGVGIDEDELPKIFGRFYRSEATRDEEGIGLGLYLARDIIEKEGGYIKVASEIGRGTTFSVFLNVSTL